MENKRIFTVMVFPQGFDGKKLSLHIVVIPRNQNPFDPPNLPAPHNGATAFADLQPQFEINVVKGLDDWPLSNATAPERIPVKIPVAVDAAVSKKALLQAIAADLGAKINATATDKAEGTIPEAISVHKYLPESYRTAFNFTSPRHPNAKTDDSYHCAIKKDVKKDPAWKNNDDLSWGQVFAHILRQPMLARACGMIYKAEVSVEDNAALFEKGCYLYADMVNANDPDYGTIQSALLEDADGPFIKRYAARIPQLKVDEERPVFAPLLFPVLYERSGVPLAEPKGPWDQLFAELNEYNDGFAKIVHAAQPVSSNLLSERQDGAHPVKDAGIRLAWDDEQILIWYIRQLAGLPDDPATRVDAPLGVFGYRIDVKQEGATDWNSLNLVRSKQVYSIGGTGLGNAANEEVELPYQVYPTQPDNNKNGPFWLPMYFTNWTGKSLVLKDSDAVRIHKNTDAAKPVAADNLFEEVAAAAQLRYSNTYEFRVRMMDISGGGPGIDEEIYNNAPAPTAKLTFKRYLAPDLCRIEKPDGLLAAQQQFFNESIVDGNSEFDANPVLYIKRPLLNYPAVVFTNKYQAAGQDPVQLLIQTVEAAAFDKLPAIADPDVTKVEIKVEVETLRLDNLESDDGRENYITLYRTTRAFSAGFEDELTLPVVFHDVAALNLGNQDDPFNMPALNKPAIDAMSDIPLPTARKIRLSVRAVCDGDSSYFGFINEADHELDSRYGKTTQFWFYRASGNEDDLLLPKPNVAPIQALYLQPDPVFVNDGSLSTLFFFREKAEQMPDMVQRLAQKLGVVSRNLTLVGKKGERVVFGCNNKIRHHLSPDQSSITFSSKGDLSNHWISCLVYRLNRDWSWDALQDVSFTIGRKKKFRKDDDIETEQLGVLGDIELKHYASFESLTPDEFGLVNRSSTTLIFIDAIEPKTALKQGNDNTMLRYPDELEVEYVITPHFKPGHGSPVVIKPEKLLLPATVAPAQVPKIVSVGIAFSPYHKNEKYSTTEPRQRFLWVELDEPVKDPNDALFCRLLHYAPDQLLSNNLGIATDVAEDPPLPIDPEYTRSITPNQTDDLAGFSAMQLMEKASDDDNIHYLLPLPPGLHAESPELFGFFTYEFRIGHSHWSSREDNLWSTAQGRFGRPLRVTGIQHPAPTLLCNVNRDKDHIYVSAPYAKAVWKGKNVTADPPRTKLHCALYAQVKQADGLAYRNILLDVKPMQLSAAATTARTEKETAKLYRSAQQALQAWTAAQTDEPARAGVLLSHLMMLNEVDTLQVDAAAQKQLKQLVKARKAGKPADPDKITARKMLEAYEALYKTEISPVELSDKLSYTTDSLIAGAKIAILKEQVKTAAVAWYNQELIKLLSALGLPDDAPLSVLVIEVFGNITNLFEHFGFSLQEIEKFTANNPQLYAAIKARHEWSDRALTDALGQYRILRTSPLTEVPFVCCPTCGW